MTMDAGATHFTGQGMFDAFQREFGRDISTLWEPDDIGTIKSFEASLTLDVGLVRNSVGTTTTTIFPIVNAGGKADMGAQRSISVACGPQL
jgi:hypothetical protein